MLGRASFPASVSMSASSIALQQTKNGRGHYPVDGHSPANHYVLRALSLHGSYVSRCGQLAQASRTLNRRLHNTATAQVCPSGQVLILLGANLGNGEQWDPPRESSQWQPYEQVPTPHCEPI